MVNYLRFAKHLFMFWFDSNRGNYFNLLASMLLCARFSQVSLSTFVGLSFTAYYGLCYSISDDISWAMAGFFIIQYLCFLTLLRLYLRSSLHLFLIATDCFISNFLIIIRVLILIFFIFVFGFGAVLCFILY